MPIFPEGKEKKKEAKIESIKELINNGKTKDIEKIFKYTFKDYPKIFFKDGSFDIAVVCARGSREVEILGPQDQFLIEKKIQTQVRGRQVSFSRVVRAGATCDALRIADLISYLMSNFKARYPHKGIGSDLLTNPINFMDITLPEEALQRNLVVLGSGDTNFFACIVSIVFQSEYQISIPIRFRQSENYYFTSEHIISELTGKDYQEADESGHMHSGYIVMIPNPWNKNKVIILVAGNRATGTQAGMLALIAQKDSHWNDLEGQPDQRWHTLNGNNRKSEIIPAKVVRATEAKVILNGKAVGKAEQFRNFQKKRLSQRHFITNFEFLE